MSERDTSQGPRAIGDLLHVVPTPPLVASVGVPKAAGAGAKRPPKALQLMLTRGPLSAAQKLIVVELRRMLLLPLDDLLAVIQE